MLAFHRAHDDPFTMLLFRAPNPRACGIAELDDDGRVVSFVEKPEQPKSDLANAGVYVVDADAYREIAAMRAFDLGFEVLPRFVGRMRGWVWEGYHLDIGTHEALERGPTRRPGLPRRRRPVGRTRPAVFLDRDGTLIEHVHYLSDPAQVRLLPGAGRGPQAAPRRGVRPACCDQPVGDRPGDAHRGAAHDLIHDEMNRQLAEAGTAVDAIYYCPEAPAGDDRTVVEHGDRKPGPGMLLRAADELGLDLAPPGWSAT